MKPTCLLFSLLLASCCGPKGLVSVTVPEASTEGQGAAVEVVPDSLASPCDSLLDALETLKALDADTVVIHDTIRAKAQAKAREAVSAMKVAVCQWQPIDINTDRIEGRIWPGPDGTPQYKVTCKEVKSEPVPCRCPKEMPWWGWLIVIAAAVVGLFIGRRL